MNTQMARPNQENIRNQGSNCAGHPENLNPAAAQQGLRAGLGLKGELMLRVDLENEEEMVTPTIEQLSILEDKVINHLTL